MRITFLAEPHKNYPNPLCYNKDTWENIIEWRNDIVTTDLSILSFDLLTHWGFSEIYLFCGGKMHELKLGKNDWTEKELRESHNLLKIVKANLL